MLRIASSEECILKCGATAWFMWAGRAQLHQVESDFRAQQKGYFHRRQSFGWHVGFISDPVQGTGEIVRDQERAIRQLGDVHGTPGIGAGLV